MELCRHLGGGGHGGAEFRQHLDHPVAAGAGFLNFQGIQHTLLEPLVPGGRIVQDHAAADGLQRRIEPDHEPVSGLGGDGIRQPQLGVAALPGIQGIPVQQHHLGQLLLGGVV